MSYLTAILIGIVQGFTELLPVSGSGHLAMLQNFFRLADFQGNDRLFGVMLHFGTLISILLASYEELGDMLRELLAMAQGRRSPFGKAAGKLRRRMLLLIFLATLPLLLVIPVRERLEALSANGFLVGAALIVSGSVLLAADRIGHGSKTERQAGLGDMMLVGFGQLFGAVPGISRVGMTFSAGLLCGFDRAFAARVAVLLSIPAILGANLFSMADAFAAGADWSLLPQYLAGTAAAAVAGYLAIRFLRRAAANGSFSGFACYCWGAGAVSVILSLIR